MAKSPAYQWYPKDILSSARVAELDLKEECAYRRALDFCWLNGNLPSNPKKLSKIIGKGCSVKIAAVIIPLFTVSPDDPELLIHDRLEIERCKQAEWISKSSEAGKKSAERRAKLKAEEESNVGCNLVEPPLPNGTNQNPTLQFASSIPLREREAQAREISSTNTPENQTSPVRPDYAPTMEQALLWFDHKGKAHMAEAFMRDNDENGWKYRDGSEIRNWETWASGFIKRTQASDTKAQAKAEKAAEKEKGKKPKASGYQYTREDFYTEAEWLAHLKQVGAEA